MKKLLIFYAIVTVSGLLFPSIGFSQDRLVLVTGRVTDFVTGEPIDGAVIRSSGVGTAISQSGEYELLQVPGTWLLSVSQRGTMLMPHKLKLFRVLRF